MEDIQDVVQLHPVIPLQNIISLNLPPQGWVLNILQPSSDSVQVWENHRLAWEAAATQALREIQSTLQQGGEYLAHNQAVIYNQFAENAQQVHSQLTCLYQGMK